MNLILKRDPIWLGSLTTPNGTNTLVLIGGDGQQVAVPATLLLAVSHLAKSILIDLPSPAYSPCFLSLPAATGRVLEVVKDILTSGRVAGDHGDQIEEIRQVFVMLGVEALLVSCQLESIQVGQALDIIKLEPSPEETDSDVEEGKVEIDIIVKIEDREHTDIEMDKITESNKNGNFEMHIKSVHDLIKIAPPLSSQIKHRGRPIDKTRPWQCPNCQDMPAADRHLCHFANCGKTVTKNCHLEAQLRNHMGAKPLQCPEPGCRVKFVRADDLRRHSWKHTNASRFMCKVCGRRYYRKDRFKIHIGKCSQVNQVSQEECIEENDVEEEGLDIDELSTEEADSTVEEGKIEMDIIAKIEVYEHTDFEVDKVKEPNKILKNIDIVNVIQCNICQQTFTRKHGLKNHIKIVHDKIKIQCKMCSKKFSKKETLVAHIKFVHDQIKIQCDLCPLQFSYKESLLRHVKTVHDQIKIHCNLCSKKFAAKRNLLRHIKSYHGRSVRKAT